MSVRLINEYIDVVKAEILEITLSLAHVKKSDLKFTQGRLEGRESALKILRGLLEDENREDP